MPDPAEVTAVVDAYDLISTPANKKLCTQRIWEHEVIVSEADSIDLLETVMMNDVRSKPGKYNINF